MYSTQMTEQLYTEQTNTEQSNTVQRYTEQPYDAYREMLAALAVDEPLLAAIDTVGVQHGWWSTGRRWRRTYGRFHLGKLPLVTLLFETIDAPQEICTIDLFREKPDRLLDGQAVVPFSVALPTAGWLRLTRFPNDPQLPTLPALLTQPGDVNVLRYRPNKRCTMRFTQPESGEITFAKLFADARGEAIHQEGVALWRAFEAGELDVAVARPLRWDGEVNTLWQETVAGKPIVARLLSAEGPTLAERVGRAAASITHTTLRPQKVTSGKTQLKRSIKYARRLGTFMPALAPAIDLILEKLTVAHAEIDVTRFRPIHGAPHAHQWLDDGARLGLVDFDGFALGDPELDAATFITEMDFEDWMKVPVAQINRRFLSAYETVAGPLDQRLLAAYCAHKRLSKALRNAYAVRTDNDMRVERALGRALVSALQIEKMN